MVEPEGSARGRGSLEEEASDSHRKGSEKVQECMSANKPKYSKASA